MKKSIEEYKTELIEHVTKSFNQEAELESFIQVYASKEGEKKPVLIFIDTPFSSSEDKIDFVENGIPQICKTLKKEKLTPLFVAFGSEAYITIIDKRNNEKTKKEVIVINISSENENENLIYDIVRHPYEVNEDGDLKQKVELVLDTNLSKPIPGKEVDGLFSNLFDKFAKGLKY